MGNGLEQILKIHGQIHAGDVTWVWDYANDCPKKKSEMTKKEFAAAIKAHKNKGVLQHIGHDKIEYSKK